MNWAARRAVEARRGMIMMVKLVIAVAFVLLKWIEVKRKGRNRDVQKDAT
jgi:hypothetical protein